MKEMTEFFLNLFNEFSKAPCPKVEAFLEIASLRVPERVWGSNTKYARCLLAAHMLTASGFNGLGGKAGAVTQETVGDLSRSYQPVPMDPGSGDAALMTTRYGIDFIALRNETIISATTVRQPNWHSRGCGSRGWE